MMSSLNPFLRPGHWAAVVLILLQSIAWAAPAAGVVTILEGEATAMYGAVRVGLSEGVRLEPATIIETGPKTTLLRIDEPDGTAIELGPGTRAMLKPPGFSGGGRRSPELYLLQGWVKISTGATAGSQSLVSPALGVRALMGVAVVCVDEGTTMLFVQSGQASLAERRNGKEQAVLSLRGGDFYTRSGINPGEVLPRPSAAMLQRLPPAYRETLPSRAAAFEQASTEARPLAAPGYAQVQAWLAAEPALRRPFPQRFAAWAREPEFRRALAARLSAHPEWRRVLFPPETDATRAATALPQAVAGVSRPEAVASPGRRP